MIKVKDRIKVALFNAEVVNVEVINKVYMLRFFGTLRRTGDKSGPKNGSVLGFKMYIFYTPSSCLTPWALFPAVSRLKAKCFFVCYEEELKERSYGHKAILKLKQLKQRVQTKTGDCFNGTNHRCLFKELMSRRAEMSKKFSTP